MPIWSDKCSFFNWSRTQQLDNIPISSQVLRSKASLTYYLIYRRYVATAIARVLFPSLNVCNLHTCERSHLSLVQKWLSSPTQKIMKKLQTRTLRQIKYFPQKTRTSAILGYSTLSKRNLHTSQKKSTPRKENSKQFSIKCSTWLVDRGT